MGKKIYLRVPRSYRHERYGLPAKWESYCEYILSEIVYKSNGAYRHKPGDELFAYFRVEDLGRVVPAYLVTELIEVLEFFRVIERTADCVPGERSFGYRLINEHARSKTELRPVTC